MNLARLWAVARKEAIHVRRDPRSLALAVGVPMSMLLIFGYALTLDVDHVPFVVWDQCRSVESRELVAQFAASRYFDFRGGVEGCEALERAIDTGEAEMALVVPSRFAEDLLSGREAPVQAIVDGADSNTAGILLGYARAVTAAHNRRILLDWAGRATGAVPADPIDLRIRVWFNPDLESRNFIVPGIMAVIMGLIAALLTSLTLAREWERGTMEQLVATPVQPAELVVGKLVPYAVVGAADLAIAVLMAVVLFRVPLRGSVALLGVAGALFIVATLAQGILISAAARQQLLASQLAMVSTFLPAFLLSGFAFAISNMPPVVRAITHVVPARYFVSLVKGIFLRGAGLEVLWPDALFLLVFGIVVTGLAIRATRKRIF
jgi:ABC-2 type transport system permease protein